MNEFIESVRRKYEKCVSNSCSAHGCKLLVGTVKLDYLVILDLDEYVRFYADNNGKICDFIVFYCEGDIIVCAAELKSGSFKAKEVKDQIQEGARIAERILSRHLTNKFYPVLVRNRSKRLDPLVYKFLQNTLIKFQSLKVHIGIVPSKTLLESIFMNAG